MQGIIYCIKSINSNIIYIGSTIQPLAIRKSKHIYDSKKPLRAKPIHRFINKNGSWSNFVFEKLEQKEYENINELREEEFKIIHQYKIDENYKLLNAISRY